MQYQRVLLKLSGEQLAGEQGFGYCPGVLAQFAQSIKRAQESGVEIAIVIGGGNIFRGAQGLIPGFNRSKGDQMGMLATVINGIALCEVLNNANVPAVTLSAAGLTPLVEQYTIDRAANALTQGRVVVLTGGTGNPFFTTDTAAALRAAELECDLLLKGTRVDGVYTADPEVEPNALRYTTLSFDEAYQKGLKIMDLTAFTLCKENDIPIIVFKMDDREALVRIVEGESIGTLIQN